MGKRRPRWNHDLYLKYLREGRGQGEGADYKPWITVHDFPSSGVVSRIPGRKTNRIHHLLSRNEAYYFYILDDSPKINDIREQFPLRLSETIEIARNLGIPHPKVNGFPFVMTTDFLLTTGNGLSARTVKLSKDLQNPRVREKFEIERIYWSSRGYDWKIVTEQEIPVRRAINLKWLYSGAQLSESFPDPGERQNLQELFLLLYQDPDTPFQTILEQVEQIGNHPHGTGIMVFKSLLQDGRIQIDMDKNICFAEPRQTYGGITP